jgi:hypothetical protein
VANKAKAATRITAAEIKYMRITAGHTWIDKKTNTEIAKELNTAPLLDKIQDYKGKWMQYVNRMQRNRSLRLKKKLHPKRQKGPRKSSEETSGYVRPERVNKWTNSLIAT